MGPTVVDLPERAEEGQVTDAAIVTKPAGGDAKAARGDDQQAELSPVLSDKSIQVGKVMFTFTPGFLTKKKDKKAKKVNPEYRKAKKERRDARKAKKRAMKRNRQCRICDRFGYELTVGRMVIDHDHKTDIIRGWLCDPCNGRLGRFECQLGHFIPAIPFTRDTAYTAWATQYYGRIMKHLSTNTGLRYSRDKAKFIKLP